MNISKFEAAVIYDYRKKEIKNNTQYLILDLDECSFGICLCDKNGEVKLIDNGTISENYNLWNECVSQVKKFLGNRYLFDVQKEMINQILTSNNAVENYLRSNRVFDSVMFRFGESTISCSEFENCMKQIKKKLYVLLEEVSKRIPSDRMLNVKIIVLGDVQKLNLIDYYIREYFSAESFLADDRFMNAIFKEQDSKVVEIGMKYHLEKNNINHTYTLMFFNKQTETMEKIDIVKNGQSKDDLKELQYMGPIYLSKDEMLSIQIDSETRKIEMPYTFKSIDDDLIEATIGIKDDVPNIFIRRCRFPTQVYTVELR